MERPTTMTRTLTQALAVFVLVLGCGGGSSGGACAGDDSCGGDVVGTWDIASTCLSGNLMGSVSCPSATLDISGLREDGSLTWNSDLTYTTTVTVSGAETETFPDTCLPMLNVASCDELNTKLQATLQLSSMYARISCTATSNGCRCTFEYAPQPTTTSGTYTTSGAMLTSTTSGGKSSKASYCVQGTRLLMSGNGSGSAINVQPRISFTKR